MEEKIYIGKNYQLIIEQTIGSKIFDLLKEKYEVKQLTGNKDIIFLIEEKDNVNT